MYKKLWFCGALLCTALAYSQTADEEIESLDEVVLIDSKFEIKRENSGKVVTRITGEEIERSSGQSIAEVINRISGIEINGTRSNDGQNLGYYVRGGRNRQVVILVDGVQLSDASSIANDFDLRLLPLDQVASIEIIKGASSTLYGSGAATAVVNISTKEPVKKIIGLQLQTIVGTNNSQINKNFTTASFDNAVAVSGRASKFDYQVNLSNRFSESMSAVKPEDTRLEFEDDPFNKYNVYARFGYKISERLKFHFFGNYDKFNSSFDDSFMYQDADNNLNSAQFRTGSHWVASYSNGSFIFSDSYTVLDREVTSAYPVKYDSKVYSFDAHNKYTFKEIFHTVIGLNGVLSEFNSYGIPFGESNFEQTASAEEANFDIIDPYMNLVYISGWGFNFNSGARLNIHSEYGNHLVYNINPSYTYALKEGYLKALVSYGTAYITPSLYQLYDTVYGNLNLNPEESHTLEGGLEYEGKNFRLSGVYFERKTRNFVDFVTIDAENFLSQFRNIDETFYANGVEVELKATVIPKLDLTGNYTYTRAAQRFSLRIPAHKINATLAYKINEKTFTSLTYQFNDKRSDSFFNNETFTNDIVDLSAYGILDYYLSHTVNDNIRVFAGVSNITNETYEEIYRFTTRGRNAQVGLALNF